MARAFYYWNSYINSCWAKGLAKVIKQSRKSFRKIKQVSREFYDQINETAEIEELNNLKNNLNKHTDLESYIKDSNTGVGVKKSGKVKLKKSNL